MAKATELTMEWVTWMNSILKGPISTICLGFTMCIRGSSSRSVFLHAALYQGQVKAVP